MVATAIIATATIVATTEGGDTHNKWIHIGGTIGITRAISTIDRACYPDRANWSHHTT
jgi:hypothetical protein